MDKRGQFFLIAALVIVGIIITLGAINISIRTPLEDNTAFYDLSREIDYESNKLIDYGVYESQSRTQINEKLASLVSNYAAINPDTEMLLIYGSAGNLFILYYNETSAGVAGISSGGPPTGIPQKAIKPQVPEYNYNTETKTVEVTLAEDSVLTFELKEGENFFIVLKKESGGETLVAKE